MLTSASQWLSSKIAANMKHNSIGFSFNFVGHWILSSTLISIWPSFHDNTHILCHARISINTLRPWEDDRHFADNIFTCIFLYEKVWISINIPLKFVPKGQINKIRARAGIKAWCRPGDESLSESMMVNLTTHVCVTQPNELTVFGTYRRRCETIKIIS